MHEGEFTENDFDRSGLMENIGTYHSLGSSTIGHIFMDRSGRVSHDLADYPQLLHPEERPSEECIAMYIFRESQRTGFVLSFPDTELKKQIGLSYMKMIAGYLADAAEFTAAESPHQTSISVLQHLIAGEQPSPLIRRRFEAQTGLSEHLRILAFDSHAIRNYTLRRLLVRELESSGRPCLGCEYEEQTVLLTTEKETENIVSEILKRFPSENVSVGISMTAQGTGNLREAYLQALFALRDDERPGVRYCRDLAMTYLMDVLRRDEMASYLIHPAFTVLQEYDALHASELLKTLTAYVKNGFFQYGTAESLHIHLNTLKYRLKKIEEMTGLTFHDAGENFYLRLSAEMRSAAR